MRLQLVDGRVKLDTEWLCDYRAAFFTYLSMFHLVAFVRGWS